MPEQPDRYLPREAANDVTDESDDEERTVVEMTGGRLKDAVALVTGASSGIGEATARALAEEGAAVALVARRKDRLDALAVEIGRSGGRALALQADVTAEAQARAAVRRTIAELGRLDILVNNAGVMLLGPIVDAPTQEWDRMIALNLQGLLYATHAALPHLLAAAQDASRGVSDVVNVSSVAGRRARSGAGVYSLSKFGVNAFSESLRQEVTARHVRVSVIEPGAVRTELFDHVRPEVRERSTRSFANIEMLQAGDVADAIRYVVTRPRHVAINELLVRPTEQEL